MPGAACAAPEPRRGSADHRPGWRWPLESLGSDLPAGVTVALVAIPQCMAFATLAGLPAISGIYSAVAMGLVGAAISGLPRLVIGPAITASTLLLGVLSTVAPDDHGQWPTLAALLALLVGVLTILGGLLNIGRSVRFVSRSVISGLVAGSALLTLGSQLAPALGVAPAREPMLAGVVWNTLRHAEQARPAALLLSLGTFAMVVLGTRVGGARFPAAFVSLLASGAVAWWLERRPGGSGLESIGGLAWEWPRELLPLYRGPYSSDLLVGAVAITLVGIVQHLAIGQALAQRGAQPLRPARELWALGLANIAAGLVRGLPGSASFARSALSDLAGARTRLSGLIAALATGLIAAGGAPLARYVTLPAIAGLLAATALSIVDWRELARILTRERHDRPVLLTTVLGVLVFPIHWALVLGLVVSIVIFLTRVSRLHLTEMVRTGEGTFREQPVDGHTGHSAITLLAIEGPLFFAHAEELGQRLSEILRRGPQVTVLRTRRVQQIDFSALTALERVIGEYVAAGGRFIFCGLTPAMRQLLLDSPLGRLVGPEGLLETTREVFGSARQAIALAEHIVDRHPASDRPRFRALAERPRAPASAEPG